MLWARCLCVDDLDAATWALTIARAPLAHRLAMQSGDGPSGDAIRLGFSTRLLSSGDDGSDGEIESGSRVGENYQADVAPWSESLVESDSPYTRCTSREVCKLGAAFPLRDGLPQLARALDSTQDEYGTITIDEAKEYLEVFLKGSAGTSPLNPVWNGDDHIVLTITAECGLYAAGGPIVAAIASTFSMHGTAAVVEIRGIRIATSHRQQKLGTRLLLELQLKALEKATKLGVNRLELSIPPSGQCHRNVAACSLYISCDWTVLYKPAKQQNYAKATREILRREMSRLDGLIGSGKIDVIRIEPRVIDLRKREQYFDAWQRHKERCAMSPAHKAAPAHRTPGDLGELDGDRELMLALRRSIAPFERAARQERRQIGAVAGHESSHIAPNVAREEAVATSLRQLVGCTECRWSANGCGQCHERGLRASGGGGGPSTARGGGGGALCTLAPEPPEGEDDDEVCDVCGRAQWQVGNEMLLCDGPGTDGEGCSTAVHLRCLQPPLARVPSGDWLCSQCRPPPQQLIGCTKCRWSANGCGQCRERGRLQCTPPREGKAPSGPLMSESKKRERPAEPSCAATQEQLVGSPTGKQAVDVGGSFGGPEAKGVVAPGETWACCKRPGVVWRVERVSGVWATLGPVSKPSALMDIDVRLTELREPKWARISHIVTGADGRPAPGSALAHPVTLR